MNCYEFESKISAYIDGELKQSERTQFTEHKNICEICIEKLNKIKSTLKAMTQIPNYKTSKNFFHNLEKKIQTIENSKTPLWERISQFKPFGLEPVYALGAVCALAVLTISSILLFNIDHQPDINLNTITKSQTAPKDPVDSKMPIFLAGEEGEMIDDSISTFEYTKNSHQNTEKLLMVNSPN